MSLFCFPAAVGQFTVPNDGSGILSVIPILLLSFLVGLDASTDWVAALPDGITDSQTLSELEEPVAVQQFLH